MSNPEARLQRAIQKVIADDCGGYVLKVHGNAYTPTGTPDLLACIGGRFVAIEVKTPSGHLSEAQAKRLIDIAGAGGIAAVVRSVGAAVDLINAVYDGDDDIHQAFLDPELERIGCQR